LIGLTIVRSGGTRPCRIWDKVEIPVNGDSYAPTGWGVVPTHYLADAKGLVQLVTMFTVNWALKENTP